MADNRTRSPGKEEEDSSGFAMIFDLELSVLHIRAKHELIHLAVKKIERPIILIMILYGNVERKMAATGRTCPVVCGRHRKKRPAVSVPWSAHRLLPTTGKYARHIPNASGNQVVSEFVLLLLSRNCAAY